VGSATGQSPIPQKSCPPGRSIPRSVTRLARVRGDGREADATAVVEGEQGIERPVISRRSEIALAQVGVESGGMGACLCQHRRGDVHARRPGEAALAQDAGMPPPAAADRQQPIIGM